MCGGRIIEEFGLGYFNHHPFLHREAEVEKREGGRPACGCRGVRDVAYDIWAKTSPFGADPDFDDDDDHNEQQTDLMFDLEMEEEVDEAAHTPRLRIGERVRASLDEVRQPQDSFLAKLVQDVKRIAGGHARVDLVSYLKDLGGELAARGYSVSVRSALGGGAGRRCLESLRHHYLVVKLPAVGPFGAPEAIVDPSFKQQFVIADPSQLYEDVLRELPDVFVGSIAVLKRLTDWACDEMKATFEASGKFLPPWRKSSSVMSKWMSEEHIDDVLPPIPRPFMGDRAGTCHRRMGFDSYPAQVAHMFTSRAPPFWNHRQAPSAA